MKRRLSERQLQAARRVTEMVRRRGYHPLAARNFVIDAIKRARDVKDGMGQDLFEEGEPEKNILQRVSELESVKMVRESISPWLWVTSVVGFGMALMNSRRIALMFGKWRAKQPKAKTA